MRPLEHIRRNVLNITQAEMAAIAGTSQATVSRWEKGELEPNRDQLARIRDTALSRDVQWDDHFFFDAPPGTEKGAAA